MLSWIGAAILVVGFVVLIRLFLLVDHSKAVIAHAKHSAAVMRNPKLSDLEKEKQLQKSALQLFRGFFIILIGSVLALAIPAGLVWLLDQGGIIPFDETLALTLSWPFIVAISVIAVIAAVVIKQRNRRGV